MQGVSVVLSTPISRTANKVFLDNKAVLPRRMQVFGADLVCEGGSIDD